MKLIYHNNLGDPCREDDKLWPELVRESGLESCLSSTRKSCFEGLEIRSKLCAGYLEMFGKRP